MKKRMKRGSMTIEAALLMPLLLLVVTITLYLFFYVHNKVWLTAAAYEAWTVSVHSIVCGRKRGRKDHSGI